VICAPLVLAAKQVRVWHPTPLPRRAGSRVVTAHGIGPRSALDLTARFIMALEVEGTGCTSRSLRAPKWQSGRPVVSVLVARCPAVDALHIGKVCRLAAPSGLPARVAAEPKGFVVSVQITAAICLAGMPISICHSKYDGSSIPLSPIRSKPASWDGRLQVLISRFVSDRAATRGGLFTPMCS
jgi:hypothetical protein